MPECDPTAWAYRWLEVLLNPRYVLRYCLCHSYPSNLSLWFSSIRRTDKTLLPPGVVADEVLPTFALMRAQGYRAAWDLAIDTNHFR